MDNHMDRLESTLLRIATALEKIAEAKSKIGYSQLVKRVGNVEITVGNLGMLVRKESQKFDATSEDIISAFKNADKIRESLLND